MILSVILFAIGLLGFLTRRNLIFLFLSLEIMLNAAAFGFVIGSASWGQPDGILMFLFILTVAAAEVAIGLALVLQVSKQFKHLNIDNLSQMKG